MQRGKEEKNKRRERASERAEREQERVSERESLEFCMASSGTPVKEGERYTSVHSSTKHLLGYEL